MNTYTFIISSLIIILIPGTGVLYTIQIGMMQGKKAGIAAAVGCTAGIIPHLFISIVFSSLLQKMNNQAFFALQMAGAFYLLYLGIEMIRSTGRLEHANTNSQEKMYIIIYRGIFMNLLNPKLTLFFFSFLPQYVSHNSHAYMQESMVLGIIFMLLTFTVFSGYGILSSLINHFIEASPQSLQHLQQIFGIIFIAFAAKLAFNCF